MKYMKENGVTTAKAVPDGQGAIPNYVGIDDKLVAVLFAMDSPRATMCAARSMPAL